LTLGENRRDAKKRKTLLVIAAALFGEKDKPASHGFLMVRKIDKAGNIREVGGPCGV
jgi:hypothetical protein